MFWQQGGPARVQPSPPPATRQPAPRLACQRRSVSFRPWFRPSCEASLSLNQGLRKASQREEILAAVLIERVSAVVKGERFVRLYDRCCCAHDVGLARCQSSTKERQCPSLHLSAFMHVAPSRPRSLDQAGDYATFNFQPLPLRHRTICCRLFGTSSPWAHAGPCRWR